MTEDLKYLTLTLYGEARGEPIESIIGVGSVIRNRVLANKQSYKDVVLTPKQFSCWNADDPNRKLLDDMLAQVVVRLDNDRYLKQCLFIADGIIGGQLLTNVSNATHYIESSLYDKLGPDHWSKKLTKIAVKGHHIFLV